MEDSFDAVNEKTESPKRYLGLAVVSTIFFFPLGIVAIIKSLKVDDYVAMQNFEAAYYASKDAKRFGIFALVIGLINCLCIFLFVLMIILLAFLAN